MNTGTDKSTIKLEVGAFYKNSNGEDALIVGHEESNITLAVGRAYKNRVGYLIHIVAHRTPACAPDQPFIDHEEQTYTERGWWMTDVPTLFDLVEEVPSAPFPAEYKPTPIVDASQPDTRAEQIQRLSPYFAGIALGRKDVHGQPCPAVIHDGDSVLALFPGSEGTAQAHLFADLLNYLVDALPAQAAIDAVADRGTDVTVEEPGSFERAFKADEFKIAATRCLLDHGDDLINVIKTFRAIHDAEHPVLAEPQEGDRQIFRTRHFGASLEVLQTADGGYALIHDKIEKARGVPANELIKKLEPFIYKY
jgi:hypothetical protein